MAVDYQLLNSPIVGLMHCVSIQAAADRATILWTSLHIQMLRCPQ